MNIAIVGHDKSLPGHGFGSLIDSHDYIVKMLNCGWHNPADYGARYDFAVATKSSFNLASIKTPEIETWIYSKNGGDVDSIPQRTRDITFLLRYYVNNLLPKLARRHVPNGISKGCAAVLGAIHLFSPDLITLFGMGQLSTGNRQRDRHPEIYREQLTDQEKMVPIPYMDHHWWVEHQLILTAAEHNKCKLLTNIGD